MTQTPMVTRFVFPAGYLSRHHILSLGCVGLIWLLREYCYEYSFA
jgi:hypothetical protein